MPYQGPRRDGLMLLPCFYFVEIPMFGCATVLAYLLHFTSVFKTEPVIYNPDDLAISKPYLRDENTTEEGRAVLVISVFVPVTLIIVVETILLTATVCCKCPHRSTIRTTHSYVGESVRRVVRFVGMFFFGATVTSALCDVLRKNVASLSPHFLSVCQSEYPREELPEDVAKANIIDVLGRDVTYFSDDCSPWIGVDELKAARLQSPSYLVSITSFCAVYSLMYVRLVVHFAGPAVRSTLLFATILFPYIIGLKEIAEYRSHTTSAVYGWMLGSGIAYFVAHKIFAKGFIPYCKLPKICKRKRKKEENTLANVFEEAPTPNFSARGYHVTENDDSPISSHGNISRVIEHKAQVINTPQMRTLERLKSGTFRTTKSSTTSVNTGHTVERRVIKELKAYMPDGNRIDRMESPKPTQIRELSRGTNQNKRQGFSTFQATPEAEDQEACRPTTSNLTSNRTEESLPETPVATTATFKFSPTFTSVSSFQNAPPLRGRPFSYHGRNLSESSDGSFGETFKQMPRGTEMRPTSFSHPLRTNTPTSQLSVEMSEPEESILSCFTGRLHFTTTHQPDLNLSESESTITSQYSNDASNRTLANKTNFSRQYDADLIGSNDQSTKSLDSTNSDGTIKDQKANAV